MKKFFSKVKKYISAHGNYYGFVFCYFFFSVALIGRFSDVLPEWFMLCWVAVYFLGCSIVDRLDFVENKISEIEDNLRVE